MKTAVSPALLLVVVSRASCSQPAPPPPAAPPGPDLGAEERAIRETDARWLKAAQSRDAAGEAAMLAADGIAFREHLEPIVGPAAFQAYPEKQQAANPKSSTSWTTDTVRVARSGDVGGPNRLVPDQGRWAERRQGRSRTFRHRVEKNRQRMEGLTRHRDLHRARGGEEVMSVNRAAAVLLPPVSLPAHPDQHDAVVEATLPAIAIHENQVGCVRDNVQELTAIVGAVVNGRAPARRHADRGNAGGPRVEIQLLLLALYRDLCNPRVRDVVIYMRGGALVRSVLIDDDAFRQLGRRGG